MFMSRRLHIHFLTVGNFTIHFSFHMRLRFIVKHNVHPFNVSSIQLGERCINVYFSLISMHIYLCDEFHYTLRRELRVISLFLCFVETLM